MRDMTVNVDAFEVVANGRTKRFDAEDYPKAEDWYFACRAKGADNVVFKAVVCLED